jgi:hypothetical protein
MGLGLALRTGEHFGLLEALAWADGSSGWRCALRMDALFWLV